MAENPTVTEELIRILCRKRDAGTSAVALSPKIAEEFFADASGSAAKESTKTVNQSVTPETRASAPTTLKERMGEGGETAAVPAGAARDSGSTDALSLTDLAQRVGACTACPLHKGRTQTVFGEGAADARLMFIGEGPGRDEDQQGRPFVGKAGKLLTQMIHAMQFSREQVYIANIVKCRPPANRAPEDAEANACMPYLQRQIDLIKPEVIVLLGAVPLQYMLNRTGITRLHGEWLEYQGIPVMPTFHPAYLLRMRRKKADAWEDLKKVMIQLGKDPEATMRDIKKRRDAGPTHDAD